jgi:hypothetical protein
MSCTVMLIFERCIGVFSLVFSVNQKNVNLLHYWEGEEGTLYIV